MDELQTIALEHGLHLVEDAAHALPTTYRGKKVGTISELTAFSFYATKTLTTAEGGMLTTNDEEHIKRVSLMRLHGIGGDAWKRYSATGSWYYEVQDAGYKMNLCDILSALGRAQLRKCDGSGRTAAGSGRNTTRHSDRCRNSNCRPPGKATCTPGICTFFASVPNLLEVNRNQFIEELKKLGIGTSVHFIPLHLHPYYSRTYGYAARTISACQRCLFTLHFAADLS